MPRKDPEEHRQYSRDYYYLHREDILNKRPEQRRKIICKLKNEIFELLGNKCSNPFNLPHPDWCNDIRILQIDHVYGRGKQEIKCFSDRFKRYRHIRDSILKGERNHQLLCPNCNWLKRVENKEYYEGK